MAKKQKEDLRKNPDKIDTSMGKKIPRNGQSGDFRKQILR